MEFYVFLIGSYLQLPPTVAAFVQVARRGPACPLRRVTRDVQFCLRKTTRYPLHSENILPTTGLELPILAPDGAVGVGAAES